VCQCHSGRLGLTIIWSIYKKLIEKPRKLGTIYMLMRIICTDECVCTMYYVLELKVPELTTDTSNSTYHSWSLEGIANCLIWLAIVNHESLLFQLS
jgi:hypothetical protein